MKVYCTTIYYTELPQNIVVLNVYVFITMTQIKLKKHKTASPSLPAHTNTIYTSAFPHVHFL